RGSASEQIDDL
ncbi:hypothetical protein D047_1303B, partial [Vibrio parahaemolyticus VPTS-2010_2]